MGEKSQPRIKSLTLQSRWDNVTTRLRLFLCTHAHMYCTYVLYAGSLCCQKRGKSHNPDSNRSPFSHDTTTCTPLGYAFFIHTCTCVYTYCMQDHSAGVRPVEDYKTGDDRRENRSATVATAATAPSSTGEDDRITEYEPAFRLVEQYNIISVSGIYYCHFCIH